jgi:hypothetical protein
MLRDPIVIPPAEGLEKQTETEQTADRVQADVAVRGIRVRIMPKVGFQGKRGAGAQKVADAEAGPKVELFIPADEILLRIMIDIRIYPAPLNLKVWGSIWHRVGRSCIAR